MDDVVVIVVVMVMVCFLVIYLFVVVVVFVWNEYCWFGVEYVVFWCEEFVGCECGFCVKVGVC